MSSIRPLATITVLAFVGIFLYLKINETEPPLPEGVEDWSADTAIQFDMGQADMGQVNMDGTDPTAIPQFSQAPAESEAPAFSMNTATPGDTAPAFQVSEAAALAGVNPPTSIAPPVAVAEAPSFGVEQGFAASGAATQLPDLPPLPSLPPAPSSAPSVDVVAEVVAEVVPPVMSAKPQATLPAGASVQATSEVQAQTSLFSTTRTAVQAALDRGELSQALLLLSDWYGDPSLSPGEAQEVNSLLGQLAGSVIYSTEHRLKPSRMVQAGEQLETIAKEYQVPWQLLAKINGISSADQLKPGQKLKVIEGPFSALIDISQRKMTLMLGRRYAGRFSLEIDPGLTVEEGHWEVNQKLLTPANVSLPGTGPTTPTEERSLMLSNSSGATTQVAILRGATTTNPLTETAGRVLRMSPTDAADVFDILSLGSTVVIRR